MDTFQALQRELDTCSPALRSYVNDLQQIRELHERLFDPVSISPVRLTSLCLQAFISLLMREDVRGDTPYSQTMRDHIELIVMNLTDMCEATPVEIKQSINLTA